MIDVCIVGGGPIGLACGIASKRRGLSHLIFEKGALVNSLVHYPTDLEFFSTPELLEVGDIPFTSRNYKPVRAEALEYYRHVATSASLNIRLYEGVQDVSGEKNDFLVTTTKGTYRARNIVVATGFFDHPILLNVPGEDLPKVTHYYREPFLYTQQDVLVVGSRNSAAKAALDCYRHGARVTMAIRGDAISSKVKYWIKPDLENRISEGSISAYYNSDVQEIREKEVVLQTPDGSIGIANDWVLAMTGYHPDFDFLRGLGITISDDPASTPVYDSVTMETNRPGVFLAGVVCGGFNTNTWFIENSRIHADMIMDAITRISR